MKEQKYHSHQPPDPLSALNNSCENEIDLGELLAILWRRRSVMIGVVLLCTLLGLVYCLITTPLFEIDSQIRPGITGYDSKGSEVRSLTPEAIKFWFSKKGYSGIITKKSSNLSRPIDIKASSQKDSDMVDISFYWPDKDQGVAILKKILQAFSDTLNKNMHQEIEINKKKLEEKISRLKLQLQQTLNMLQDLEGQVQQRKNNITLLEAMIITLDKNKVQMQRAKKRIEQQVKNVYDNTNELIELRKEMIKAGSKAGIDKFALLMYSNIVQQNISYITNLEQRLATIEKEINEFHVKKAENKGEIENIKIEIQNLTSKLKKEIPLRQKSLEKQINIVRAQEAALQPIEIIQAPFSSPKPVKPKTKLVMTLSVVLGFFLAIFAAATIEFLGKTKTKFQD